MERHELFRQPLDDFVWKVYELTKPLAGTGTKRRPAVGQRGWPIRGGSRRGAPAMRKAIPRNSPVLGAAFLRAAPLGPAASASASRAPGGAAAPRPPAAAAGTHP